MSVVAAARVVEAAATACLGSSVAPPVLSAAEPVPLLLAAAAQRQGHKFQIALLSLLQGGLLVQVCSGQNNIILVYSIVMME